MKNMHHALVVALALPLCSAFALLEPDSPTIAESATHRAAILAATDVVAYEGLPHQTWEPDLLEKELRREDITKIGNYHFYTPSQQVKDADELRRLLSSAQSISPYRGPKACGGYHPDFCIAWKSGTLVYFALVCFGCHEVVYFDGKTSLIYDLADGTLERYKNLLARYRSKRPGTLNR